VSREHILRTLRELGVDAPGALLATHGPVRVCGALGELANELRRGGVRNPAGWLVSALVDRERVFANAGVEVLELVVVPEQLRRRWGLDAAYPDWRERAAALGGKG
jgi:hypothetical protein